jgi:WD40 repeat protein
MSRFLLAVILGVALAGGAAWYFDLWKPHEGIIPSGDSDPEASVAEKVDVGGPLYPPAADVKKPPAARHAGPAPIVVPDAHIVAPTRQDVPSIRDGQILFIGQEVFQSDPLGPAGPTQSATVRLGPRELVKIYRRLDRNNIVKPGEMVAMIDPAIALAELEAKRAKVIAARATYEASRATKQEAQARLSRLDELKRSGGTSRIVADEEYSAAVLLRDRYYQEEISKREEIKLAEVEVQQAEIVYSQHEIRNKMTGAGVIKAIFKQRGDAVKANETIMELLDIENLRAEGLVEVQYHSRLKRGMRVTLEPSQPEAPTRVVRTHRGDVTAVAISNRLPEPQVVSASEDGTVNVWGIHSEAPERVYYHIKPDEQFQVVQPVRTVACTPRGSKHNFAVSGTADGYIRLWDLNSDKEAPVWVRREENPSPISALAFSPDGRWFAAGDENGFIRLHDTVTGEPVYAFDAERGAAQRHEGAVTSLSFTPQCRLVSASRDNTLRIWNLHEKGVVAGPVITGRGGSVADLGVSQDGGWALLDQGKVLHVLSTQDGRPVAQLVNPSGAHSFETVALFSPDARMILTAGAPEGRLQLWKAPSGGSRGYEVRQLVTSERLEVTCAAFSYNAGLDNTGFAVSGTKHGYVYLWPVPTAEQVERQSITGLQLNQVDPTVDTSTRLLRIGVDVHNPVDAQNPYGKLMPGRPVTLVLHP